MSRKLAVITVAALLLGLLFSPRKPVSERMDPDELLRSILQSYQIKSNGPLAPGFHETFWLDKASRDRLVLRNYTPLVEGQERIAGREAWVLRLKPRVKYRPWRQVWVDKELTSILAVRDWSSDDRRRRTVKLDRVSAPIHDRIPAQAMCPISTTAALGSLRLPRHIPSGFSLTCVGTWSDSPRDRCIIYSDGLFNISLFYRFSARPHREQQDGNCVVACGNSRAVAVPLATGSVTVVADLPADELLRVAHSID